MPPLQGIETYELIIGIILVLGGWMLVKHFNTVEAPAPLPAQKEEPITDYSKIREQKEKEKQREVSPEILTIEQILLLPIKEQAAAIRARKEQREKNKIKTA